MGHAVNDDDDHVVGSAGPRALLLEAWRLADKLLDVEIGASMALKRPIALRLPFLFYLGHLPAFARNTARRAGACAAPEQQDPYDVLFSRGIDPDVEDPTRCHQHPDEPATWPTWDSVLRYRDDVRRAMSRVKLADSTCLLVAEHDLMHIETLYYMMAQEHRSDGTGKVLLGCSETALEANDCVQLAEGRPSALACSAEATGRRLGAAMNWIAVPAGYACLGRDKEMANKTNGDVYTFGWDNEFGTKRVQVPSFSISELPVTIRQFLTFVAGGGYHEQKFWRQEDWQWIRREKMRHPVSWRWCERSDSRIGPAAFSAWKIVTVDGLVGMSDALDWPVYTSLAEARAYANFVGAELPSEAEWDRAAYGDTSSPDALPWPGKTADSGIHGNFGFHRRVPMPVGSFPNGKSWVGVLDMVGNGWELTDTVFGPLPEFEQMEHYPEYSIDFFDGKHFVLKGASWATHTCMVRRTFRNFYQAHYPYVFSKFRLVRRND